MLDRSQTAKYNLMKVKELIVSGKCFFYLQRPKNRETMKQLGLDSDGALKEIMKLNARNFIGVDCEQGNIDADVYVKKIQSMDVYIKFKIMPEKELIVISFHQNESGVKS